MLSLLGIVISLILIPSQALTEPNTYIRIWPELPGPWYFRYPEGIAIDRDNNVYIGDGYSHIQKFDANGRLISKWGGYGSGDGQFIRSRGIAIDNSGNVYVVDNGNNRIQKFDANGRFIRKWGEYGSSDGQFEYPEGIAIDSSGNVYVADTYNHRIQKFDPNGNFITKWGSYGSGDGQFIWPKGVAVNFAGDVYVGEDYIADSGNHRIQKFDANGRFIRKWGEYGSSDGQFNHPEWIAIDGSGNVYVADTYNFRIQKFDPNGNFITKWGSYGSGDGQFSSISGIAVGSLGKVYVVDFGNNRVQNFDTEGNLIAKWQSSGISDGYFTNPGDVAIDSSGNVYVADSGNHRIQKFDADGRLITKWGSEGTGDGEFKYPARVAVDSLGKVYVLDSVDSGNRRVQRFDANGQFITKWEVGGMVGSGPVIGILDMAVDNSGNVYLADNYYYRFYNFINGRILKFDSNGKFITEWERADVWWQPMGIAVDNMGSVYVADRVNKEIVKFDSNGGFITKWGGRGSGTGQFSELWAIAVDSASNVYVNADSQIQRFDSGGGFITKWGSYGGDILQFGGSVEIAVDNSGNVYVADSVNNRIQIFPPNPSIMLHLNNDSFRPDGILDLSIDIWAGTDNYIADAYLALLAPDGRLFFWGPRLKSFSEKVQPVCSSCAVENYSEVIMSIPLDASITIGLYTFYAVLTKVGSNPLEQNNWLSNLAQATCKFTK